MKVIAKIREKQKTNSGNPVVEFTCEHCKEFFLGVFSFFHGSKFKKKGLSVGLEKFVSAINEGSLKSAFEKEKTAIALIHILCNCSEGVVDNQVRMNSRQFIWEDVVDLEVARGTLRARDILKRAPHYKKYLAD